VRNGLADLFESREIPEIGKLTALLRLHSLNAALAIVEMGAFSVGFVGESEAFSIGLEARVLLNEFVF